jgi:hypothetical protein
LLESILGRWIVLLGIHMSALHFLLEVETGNFVAGVVWVLGYLLDPAECK